MKISKFTKNFSSLVGSNFLVQLFRFLTIAILARRLGTNLFGVYSYMMLLVGYGFTFVEFGLKNYAIREFSQGRGSADLITKIFRIRLAPAFLGVFATLFFSYLAFRGYVVPASLFGLSLLIDAFLVDFIVIAKEKLHAQAFANTAQAGFVYVTTYFFVKSGNDFQLFSELFLLSHVLWVGMFYLAALPDWPGKIVSHHTVSRVAGFGLTFLVSQFFFNMQASVDFLLLGQFHYTSLLGPYSAAMKIISIPQGVIFALISTLYPKLAKFSHDLNSQEIQVLLDQSTRLLLLFIVPMVLGNFFFGGELLTLLFGSSFGQASPILKPLTLAMAFYFLGLPPMMTLLVSHRTKLLIQITLLNFGVSLGCALIPLLMGKPLFLPWAMIGAQIFFFVALWRHFRNSCIGLFLLKIWKCFPLRESN